MGWARYSVFALVAVILAGVPAYAQSANTFQVKSPSGGQPYNVNYDISGGTITDISVDTKTASLVISLQTTGDGNMTVTLPRALIDAKAGSSDDQFFVLEDGAQIDFKESKTDTDRTLTMQFPDGTEKVEIIGTQVVPEFGPVSFLVLAVAALLIVTFSARARLRFGK